MKIKIAAAMVLVLLAITKAFAASTCRSLFASSSSQERENTYDVVVVGAGPAGIALASRVRQENAGARVLVVDKAEAIGGTFRSDDLFYRLSTSFAGEEFPYPRAVQRKLEREVRDRGFDVKLRTAVEGFDDEWSMSGTKPRYRVQMNDGSFVRAKAIVFAVGKKPRAVSGFDPGVEQFLIDDRTRTESRVFTFSEVVAKYRKTTFELQFQPVAVFGSGIAAMNLVEFLHEKTSTPIVWYIQSAAKLGIKLQASEKRYETLYRTLLNSSDTRIELKTESPRRIRRGRRGYEIDGVRVGHIFLATGDESIGVRDVTSMEGAKLSPVFSGDGTSIAAKLNLPDRPPQSVYVLGSAAGTATMERSFAAAKDLANLLSTSESSLKTPISPAQEQAIVKEFVKRGEISQTPEVIFIAGLPGSFKSTIARRLENGHVVVDPDQIREMIPQYQVSFETDHQTAAKIWHAAAVQMQFPIVTRALTESRNMIIDGTMHDTTFFVNLVKRIRSQHPQYRLKLIFASVFPETARQRVEERATRTGRIVPLRDFAALDADIRRTVMVLRPFVDEFTTITTE